MWLVIKVIANGFSANKMTEQLKLTGYSLSALICYANELEAGICET